MQENIFRIGLFLVLMLLGAAAAAGFNQIQKYKMHKVELDAQMIGNRISRFFPAAMQEKDLPYSFALQKKFSAAGPLPDNWRLFPEVKRSAKKIIAEVKIARSTDLYGGGEVLGPLRRNGTVIDLWNSSNFKYEKFAGRRLYQSHPWVMGVRKDGSAFGILFDTTWLSRLDLRQPGMIKFTAAGENFPIYIIDRKSPQAVMRGLAELTGTMELPPLWALGFQQCRYSYAPAQKVKAIASKFRNKKIPCDVIWMDIDYMDGYRIFTFDPKGFSHPEKLSAYLHEHGFRGVWMIDPGVKIDPDYRIFQEGTVKDLWVKDKNGQTFMGDVWPGKCVFPDFTMLETRKWWSGLYKDFISHNDIDGVWNDMNEPEVFDGPEGSMPGSNWHRGGEWLPAGPHLKYHNVYGMLMVKSSRSGLLKVQPKKRPFILSRSNFIGGQRYAACWTGDNSSNWNDLKVSVPMSLTLGLSGQPFSGPDIGGFDGTATPELWGNWIALGAFYPFSRAHAEKKSPAKEPWSFGKNIENVARTAIECRYRLLPYIYTLFQEASQTGMPVMRPVFFADKNDLKLRSEQEAFLLGKDLLIIPKWSRKPALPKGIWRKVHLLPGKREHDGYQCSLKVRGGAILPLGRVVQHTGRKMYSKLTMLVVFDKNGKAEGKLYEDAGNGFGYRKGEFLLSTYRAKIKNGSLVFYLKGFEGSMKRPLRDIEVIAYAGDRVFKGKGIDGKVIELNHN
ncbi:glycoside hydrolase family 31 protein [Lentisphaerota bacterium ZTH]|nr:DUF5110 domain-containing protein [Lentisphaerota bacterium]WET05958.1 glycoside hydrolase family 31 protein [Lentisphaerota bacterium ZTH]